MVKRFLFACGGTAGHINPATTVASYIRKRHPDAAILFAGNPAGMEAKLVAAQGFDFAPFPILGFHRSFRPKSIGHNLGALSKLALADGRAKRIIADFKPDVVVGTGGYVCGPLLRRAAKMGIPTVTQEQNAFPGVTTKLLSRYVDVVMLAVPEAEKYLHPACRKVVVGNPVREEILMLGRDECRRRLGVSPERVCLLSFGGSLGAQRVNECVAEVMRWHYRTGRVHHIHATGRYGVELLPRLLAEKGVKTKGLDFLDIREYIDNMPECLAAADLVICRAGAITLSELEVAGRASVLIPSPNVAENHQYHNAMVLQRAGAAVVIEEKDLTGEALCKILEGLLFDPDTLHRYGHNAQSLAIVDATERIYHEILSLIE